MQKIKIITAFFCGLIIASIVLVNYSDISFRNNFTQYVIIITSIMGIMGILLAPKLNEDKAVWIAKCILLLLVPFFSIMLFFKIFFKEILDMNYFSLLGCALTIVAMVMLIRTVKKTSRTVK